MAEVHAKASSSVRHYCVPTGFPITWVLEKDPSLVTQQNSKHSVQLFKKNSGTYSNFKLNEDAKK